MPDKQIVIKLDDKQFETMMRLALAAGYTSLDEFANERLKLALEGDIPSKDKGAASSKTEKRFDEAALTMAEEELNRIHQELRVFVREAVAEAETFGVFDFAEATPSETVTSGKSWLTLPFPTPLGWVAARSSAFLRRTRNLQTTTKSKRASKLSQILTASSPHRPARTETQPLAGFRTSVVVLPHVNVQNKTKSIDGALSPVLRSPRTRRFSA